MQLVHLILSTFLDNFCSSTFWLLCGNLEVLHSVVSTFFILFEEEHFLSEVIIHFPENFCKKQLSIVC